ncbi:M20 family metallo-hydrolase [Anaerosacchariphilus polymeriproducens]|uniref:Zn-dependent hydrolase n=1 Tax=Anaerosacchariphilus polymeriproducens TaxID=1812858 RepID=A0A371AX21_9FIRM|nr:M20 family metallo-hydrolase [Anaerosacchariphilus polymeriproducens]RDU24089.1 Zn-dependent hydrolase [Anaerosacchariphilus polymeriproducens]
MGEVQNVLDHLAGYSSTEYGVTRLPFTKEGVEAAKYLTKLMRKLDLDVTTDAFGNIYGKWEGSGTKNQTILIGSHYDTVINGGRYDGALGIAVGLEVVRRLKEKGYIPNYNIEILATNDEEGVRFGNGFLGARAMLGQLDYKELIEFRDEEGISIYDAMEYSGYEPKGLHSSKRNHEDIKAFIEVHIEQGPILHKEGLDIGVVEGIVGMKRYLMTIKGQSNHAGTTPMDLRKDAIDSASKIISIISDSAKVQEIKTVATVGYMAVKPNAINVVPGEVSFGIDIRSIDRLSIENVYEAIIKKAEQIKRETGIYYEIEEKLSVDPVKLNDELIEIICQSCQICHVDYIRMSSGAGHDALAIAPYIPTGMLFIPSVNGISHHPDEYSEENTIEKAIEITEKAIIKMNEVM